MKFNPGSDRILIEPVEQAEKSIGGVFLPDTAKEKPVQGNVIAVGPGRTTEKGALVPITFYKVGDTVLYSKYSGSEVKLEGKDYIVVSEKDLLGKFEDAKVPAGVH
jgi:chaperonin GroES